MARMRSGEVHKVPLGPTGSFRFFPTLRDSGSPQRAHARCMLKTQCVTRVCCVILWRFYFLSVVDAENILAQSRPGRELVFIQHKIREATGNNPTPANSKLAKTQSVQFLENILLFMVSIQSCPRGGNSCNSNIFWEPLFDAMQRQQKLVRFFCTCAPQSSAFVKTKCLANFVSFVVRGVLSLCSPVSFLYPGNDFAYRIEEFVCMAKNHNNSTRKFPQIVILVIIVRQQKGSSWSGADSNAGHSPGTFVCKRCVCRSDVCEEGCCLLEQSQTRTHTGCQYHIGVLFKSGRFWYSCRLRDWRLGDSGM